MREEEYDGRRQAAAGEKGAGAAAAMGISELGFSWVDEDEREGEGEEGVCMHERKLVVATKVRELCEMVLDQSKRSTPLMILRPFKLVIID